VGVVAERFRGAEPGVAVDVYLPAAQHTGFTRDDWTWTRALALVAPDQAAPVADTLDAAWHAFERERASHFVNVPASVIAQNLEPRVRLAPAPTGASALLERYRDPLAALAALVAMVLLIACANVALLLSAQAVSRRREWVLRTAIGAGRGRLAQLVIVEAALLTAAAALVGTAFTAWAGAFVVSHSAVASARVVLDLGPDARTVGTAALLIALAAGLVAAWPVRHAWRTRPDVAAASGHRHTGRRFATGLIAAQVAFGMFVLFVAGLSVRTFARLDGRPLGFDTASTVIADLAAFEPQPLARWQAMQDAAVRVPGVDAAAMSMWPMLAGRSWNGFVSVDGAPAGPTQADFLAVSPGFFATAAMPIVRGRDFIDSDTQPGQAVVNETFVRMFLSGIDAPAALGHHVAKGRDQYEIVGVVRDAVYGDVHEPVRPLAFVPLRTGGANRLSAAALTLRLAPGMASADVQSALRREVAAAGGAFRLRGLLPGRALVDAQLVRERLMSMLAAFFGVVAMALVGVGLYGSLHHGVRQRAPEIAIRRAVGARGRQVAWLVARPSALAVAVGTLAGLAAGYVAAGAAASLFYGVDRSDIAALVAPPLVVLVVAAAAALAPMVRAARISPARILHHS
jgi:predicted permease